MPSGKLVAAYPATIGSSDTPSPTGTHEVARVAFNPEYTYNPNVNFKQGDNDQVLTIPPGPNGPVGSIWIALSKPTYGIHGTPDPSKIGKTESHGCVRLTNWDAAGTGQAGQARRRRWSSSSSGACPHDAEREHWSARSALLDAGRERDVGNLWSGAMSTARHSRPLAIARRRARPSVRRESRRFVLFAAILASSMGFIDGSVVSLAMPAIRADLGASLVDAQWISNGYMLFLSALVLLGGAAGDVFGVRNIFAAGIAVFMVTSLACALATDAEMLIVMRAAQGIGAAFMVPGSLAIIAKAYPPETRGRAIGHWAAFSSLTTAMGPFIGGMVLSFGADWMWRLIFAINVPIGLVALGMLYRRVPHDRPTERRRLDIPGALLATAGLGADGLGPHQLRIAGERAPRFAVRCGSRPGLRCSAASSSGSERRGRRWSSSSCSARAPSPAPMSSR